MPISQFIGQRSMQHSPTTFEQPVPKPVSLRPDRRPWSDFGATEEPPPASKWPYSEHFLSQPLPGTSHATIMDIMLRLRPNAIAKKFGS